jgi:hypothetical protein
MASRTTSVKVAAMAVVLGCAGALAGCTSGSEPGPTCSSVGGAWTVTLDYGNGLVAHDTWAISQAACDLTITPGVPDTTGPGLPGTVTGYAGTGSLGASWENPVGACLYSSRLEATVDGSTLSGAIDWGRNGHGNGYCAASLGQIAVKGTR